MFSDVLKKLRSDKRISQTQLAEAIGVSAGNVGDWERDRSKPGYAALSQLAIFFGVTGDYLLEFDHVYTRDSNVPNLKCDGVPLNESEADVIAMYRLVDDADKKTVFDILKMKYEQATGKRESIYSTYSDAKKPQKSGSDDDAEITHEIA